MLLELLLPLAVLLAGRVALATPQCAGDNDFVEDGFPLAVGEQVKTTLVPKGIYGWLRLGLCSARSCSGVRVVDEESNAEGALMFMVETAATNQIAAYNSVKRSVKGPVGFDSSKNHTLVLKRMSDESFDFWIENTKPSVRVSVDSKPDEIRFKWASYIGSIYTVPDAARGDIVMAEGQTIKVKLQTAQSQNGGMLGIGMCGTRSCDKLIILTVDDESRIGYEMRRQSTNALHGAGRQVKDRTGPDGSFRGDRNYTFVIQRLAQSIEVWVDGSPDKKITMATQDDILRVTSSVGSTLFIHGRKEDILKKFGATCGRAKAGPEELVVNGNKSSIDSVPWHAGLYQQINSNVPRKFICGGSLVSPTTVVTAAHCVSDTAGRALPASTFSIALGKTLSGWDAEDGDDAVVKSQITKIHVHKWYRGHKTKLVNDIAILELATCAKIGDNVFPICVDSSIKGYEEEPVKVPGWGDGDVALVELESVVLSYMSSEECKVMMDANLNQLGYVTEDKFCSYRITEETGSQGLITGDSGGGAVIKRGKSWYLQGIVSSRLRGKRGKTDVDVYTFTDFNRHLGWVSRFLNW